MGGSAAETLLTFGVSNAVLAAVLALAAFALARLSRHPPLAHFAWLLVLLKLLAPPLLVVPLAGSLPSLPGWPGPPSGGEVAGDGMDSFPSAGGSLPSLAGGGAADEEELLAPGGGEAGSQAANLPAEGTRSLLAPTLAVMWLGTGGLFLAVAAARIVRFDRLLRSARPAPVAVRAEVQDLARRLGLARAPAALVVEARIPPLVWTFCGPARIVLPAGLLSVLSDEQRRMLIAHEIAHLRRRDHWLRWVEMAAMASYWWHPVAWWARREFRKAEEQCCDAWVQREFTGRTREYAKALFSTVEFLSGARIALPRTASGLGEGDQLKRRFQMILDRPMRHRLSTPLRAVLVAAGAFLLPWAPVASGEGPGLATGGSPLDPTTGDAPSSKEAAGAGGLSGGGSAGSDNTPLPAGGGGAGADQPALTGGGGSPGADIERRLQELEAQLKALMDEVRQIRAGMAPGKLYSSDDRPSTTAGARAARRARGAPAPVNREGSVIELRADGKTFLYKRPGGGIEARDAATGKTLWESKLDDFEDHEIEVNPDRVILRDRKSGQEIVLDPRTGKQVEASRGRRAPIELTAPAGGGGLALPGDGARDLLDREGNKPLDPKRERSKKSRLLEELKRLDEERARIEEDLRRLEPDSLKKR